MTPIVKSGRHRRSPDEDLGAELQSALKTLLNDCDVDSYEIRVDYKTDVMRLTAELVPRKPGVRKAKGKAS